MNREGSTSGGTDWLDDRLQGLAAGEGFTVVNSPLRPVVERGDPWKADVRHHELKAFVEAVTAVRADGTPIAVVTDVEEDPVARVQTAVLVAQRASEGGRRVLVVDADVRHVGLSRWLSDRELDAEGLVDALQYGASVSALRRSSPTEGVDILSVGSYRPDDLDLFTEDDQKRLVAQLRAAADVVLIVAPAWLAEDRYHPLLLHADTVIVSLHLDRTLGGRLQDLIGYLSGMNIPVAGLMTYAGPDAAEQRVDHVLRATSGAVTPVPGDEESDEEPDGTSDEGSAQEPPAPAPASPDAVAADGEDDASAPAVAATDDLEWPQANPRTLESPVEDDGRSSLVFRLFAVIALVGLVAFIGWWSLSARDDDLPGDPRRDAPPVDVVESPPTDPAPADGDEETATADVDAIDRGAGAADDGTAEPPATRSDTAGVPPEDVAATSPVGAEEETSADTVTDAPVEPVEDPATTPAADEIAPPADDEEPWRADVARAAGGGWALHIASVADSTLAEQEAVRIGRERQWNPVVRGAQVDGRRWYRILVGRFDSRADAMAARSPVGELIDADWVGVVRVR